jgi:hypothetical protein
MGDSVYARNYSGNGKWMPGTIVEETGTVSVKVELEDGTVIRRHHDQLLARAMTNSELGVPLLDQPDLHDTVGPDVPVQQDMGGAVLEFDNEGVQRYPTRNRGPPDRFE